MLWKFSSPSVSSRPIALMRACVKLEKGRSCMREGAHQRPFCGLLRNRFCVKGGGKCAPSGVRPSAKSKDLYLQECQLSTSIKKTEGRTSSPSHQLRASQMWASLTLVLSPLYEPVRARACIVERDERTCP